MKIKVTTDVDNTEMFGFGPDPRIKINSEGLITTTSSVGSSTQNIADLYAALPSVGASKSLNDVDAGVHDMRIEEIVD
jgi:hypothetical protein